MFRSMWVHLIFKYYPPPPPSPRGARTPMAKWQSGSIVHARTPMAKWQNGKVPGTPTGSIVHARQWQNGKVAGTPRIHWKSAPPIHSLFNYNLFWDSLAI